MRRLLAVVLLSATTSWAASPAELEPFSFLIGEWPSSGTGQPGEGKGTAVFARSLQDRVIVRTSFAQYPGSRHDDLMVIYGAAGGVRADYYDSEGHVIRYAVTSPASGHAVFVSDPMPGALRFRLTYRMQSADTLKGEFDIAPPNAPDTFKPYLSWESRRAK
jgi:hypothetical protein